MKISRRLQQIDQMICEPYDHIWDCCCDHGLLGMALLRREAADRVHFVDAVPLLMAELQAKLTRFFSSGAAAGHWQVHCEDVAQLRLAADGRQLIIIAGVGGDLLIDLVTTLCQNHPRQALEFILCPVRHQYKVRQRLIALGLGLVEECLVQENTRFYEVIHVSTHNGVPISPVGSRLWDLSRPADQRYLSQTLGHYRRMVLSGHPQAQSIVADYERLLTP